MQRNVYFVIASLFLFLFSFAAPAQSQEPFEPRENFPNTQAAPEGNAFFCTLVSSVYGHLMGMQCFGGEWQYFIHTADVQPAKIEKGLAEDVPWSLDWEGAGKAGLLVVYLFGGEKIDTAKAFLYAQIQPVPENIIKGTNSKDDIRNIADAQMERILGDRGKTHSKKYVVHEEDFIDRSGRIFAVRTINEGFFFCGKVRIGFFMHENNLLTYTLCSNDSAMEKKTVPIFEDMMETTMIARKYKE